MIHRETLQKALPHCLTDTSFLGLPGGRRGKVRDLYDLGDRLLLITTDRQSAFDRVLAAVPFKGQVLNQVSAWWFDRTAHIVPSHMLALPHPNALLARKLRMFPVEFIVRGYLTGSTETSAWVAYHRGERELCGNVLPEGMRKNQRFPEPILTPTTKSDHGDASITPDAIVEQGLMRREDWERASTAAFELFRFGTETARQNGLILVDTKYEMGVDEEGNLFLADELHTPDSSRYWLAEPYEERFQQGLEPENIDKEFLRLWFRDHCDPYNDPVLPEAPEDLVVELSSRYIRLYESITGEAFEPQEEDPRESLVRSVRDLV